MGKSVSTDQSHSVMAILATNVDWDALDPDVLQEEVIKKPREAGAQFTIFLRNGAKVIIGEPKVIPIDRTKPFNPVEFIGKGWTIKEQDERSLALTQVDLTKVRFEDCLQKGETSVNGEEKLRRLKKMGHIRLDANVFQTLWENQELIPESWKQKTGGSMTDIFFDGTVLRNPDGRRCLLCLYWRCGEWDWSYRWLDNDWHVSNPSAVLAS